MITLQARKKLIGSLIIGFVIFAALSFLYSVGLFVSWQNRLSDTLFTQQSAREDIVIIAIDDASIQEIGRWPWDRSVYAELLNVLSENPPKVIGFDISFLEESTSESDTAFANAIASMEETDVVLASEYNDDLLLQPIEELRSVANTGIVNTVSDSDGITRLSNLSLGGDFKVFSQQIASNYSEQNFSAVNQTRINFVGAPGSFQTYRFSEVLNGNIGSQTFADKIVLIGSTAPNLHDDQAVPVSAKMSGVEIQANIIQTLLDGTGKQVESTSTTLATIFLISFVGALLFVFLSPIVVLAVILLTGFAYIYYVIFSFDNGIIRNIIYPLTALVLVGIADTVYKYFSESKNRKYIRKAFSYYLSEAVLQEVLENPEKLKLGGERKNISVLFSDIAGFTSISEKMDAHELAQMLNVYLTKMTNIVFKHEGVLDKYIGDAVMAFWGAPISIENHALSACKTALEMQEAMKDFDFSIRIGINSGDMVVGNMGSEQRFDYTLIGDNVNLGSRLEGINKVYGTSIIISESTYKMVEEEVTTRKLDTVAVKGKKDGVGIYELISLGKNIKTLNKYKDFERARKEYEEGNFKVALNKFKAYSKSNPKDEPTKMYIGRLKELISNPPADWDGVYHATSK